MHFAQVMICLSHPATVALASTKCPASRQVWQDLLRSQKFPAFLSGRAAYSRNHVLEKQIFCSYHEPGNWGPAAVNYDQAIYISVMFGILNVMAFCPAIHWGYWILKVRKTVLSPNKSTYGIHSIKLVKKHWCFFLLSAMGYLPNKTPRLIFDTRLQPNLVRKRLAFWLLLERASDMKLMQQHHREIA